MAARYMFVVPFLSALCLVIGEAYGFEDDAVSLLQRGAHAKARTMQTETPGLGHRRGRTKQGNGYTVRSYIYGKYFELCANLSNYTTQTYGLHPKECRTQSRHTGSNTVHVFIPDVGETPRPIMVHVHGGGFIGGPAWSSSESVSYDPDFVEPLLDNGVALASIQYRFVGTTYQYEGLAGEMHDEEFVEVAEDGTLSLSHTMRLAEYKPIVSWQELMPKCVYDTSRALDYLLVHASELEIDSQRVGFYGNSAGTAEVAYLSLVYPGLPGHPTYTVVSMSVEQGQISYPFLPMLEASWAMWAEELGDDAPLSTVISNDNCSHIFGVVDDRPPDTGFACPRPDVCNMSWSEESAARFCGDNWGSTTLGSLRRGVGAWPLDTPHQRGLAKLWDTAANFKTFRRLEGEPPLFVYIWNLPGNALDASALIHSPLWAREYGKVLEALPRTTVQYLVYYGDYPGLSKPEQDERLGEYNLRSSMQLSSELGSYSSVPRPGGMEMALLHCHAMGVGCKV